MPDPVGAIPLRERRSLAEMWAEYRRVVVPPDAPLVQLHETRQAFYAGAWAVFTAVNDLDEDHEPTELDMQWMSALNEEITRFARDLKKGRA